MKNKYGLSNKQWIFCEELLKNGMVVYAAYCKAYPNDKDARNGHRLLKRKEVISYLNMRFEEKQATLDRNWELANKKLQDILETGLAEEVLEAAKIVSNNRNRQKELETKLAELEKENKVSSSAPQQITFNVVTKVEDFVKE
jgi:phage terminase small subunit